MPKKQEEEKLNKTKIGKIFIFDRNGIMFPNK